MTEAQARSRHAQSFGPTGMQTLASVRSVIEIGVNLSAASARVSGAYPEHREDAKIETAHITVHADCVQTFTLHTAGIA